jgi:hypothetical protein
MIPPKLAGEYDKQTRRRDAAQAEIERMHRRFAKAISQIKPRLSTPTLYGSDTIPSPIVLPPLPDDLLARAELLTEPAMSALVAGLEQQLGEVLRAVAPMPTPEGYREPAGSGEMARGLEAGGGGQDTLTGLVGDGGVDDSMYGSRAAATGTATPEEASAGAGAETAEAPVAVEQAIADRPSHEGEPFALGDETVPEADQEEWVDFDADRGPK